jgi:hypothetical protein
VYRCLAVAALRAGVAAANKANRMTVLYNDMPATIMSVRSDVFVENIRTFGPKWME